MHVSRSVKTKPRHSRTASIISVMKSKPRSKLFGVIEIETTRTKSRNWNETEKYFEFIEAFHRTPALHEVGGSLCNSLSSLMILLDAISAKPHPPRLLKTRRRIQEKPPVIYNDPAPTSNWECWKWGATGIGFPRLCVAWWSGTERDGRWWAAILATANLDGRNGRNLEVECARQ